MGHIPTELDQFLTGSFQDFVQADRRIDRYTDVSKNSTYSQHACSNYTNVTAERFKCFYSCIDLCGTWLEFFIELCMLLIDVFI